VGPDRADQRAFGHPGAALDADLLGALIEILLAPVLEGRRSAPAPAGLASPGIGDSRGLLFAGALPPQGLILLVVLDLGTVILGHRALLGDCREKTPAP
jgi:hypothetical protein